ncbi:sensor histidine kinase [Dermatobacter hominis]|uniref:sensor histidine kinase n=1 Tax=Dermatobacter hominis TaxID=2884263 RepID=UPI001D11428E|nr:HAMP domain-containing sensor histidine kinase [Dermatobacter hominis]UDY36999.1 HAMP domain-containing histidine kinase [Dermatobacter hominis]
MPEAPEPPASPPGPSATGPAAGTADPVAGPAPDDTSAAAGVADEPATRTRMRTRVAHSVRFRLTVAVVLVVGLSLLGGGTLLTKWVESTLTNDLRTRNERIVASMAEMMNRGKVPTELFDTPSQLEGEFNDQMMSDSLISRARDLEQVISSTYFYLDGAAFSQMKVKGVDDQNRLVLFGRVGPALPDADDAVEVTQTVRTQWGDLTIHAVSPLDEIDRSVGALRAALWLGLPLLVLCAGAMTWIITGQALAPVGAITRRVRDLSGTNLDARVPVPPTEDEIALLAVTMNDMLDRLEKASVKQRQFISDASHELRSPVASIRTQLETALRYPDDVDWADVARTVLAEDDRLDHLVGNLLAMARLEEGRFGPRSDVDLDELVMGQKQRLSGLQLDLSGVSAGRVWGNRDELTSVVRNLLDNAARHCTSSVAVTVQEEGPWVVLTVGDDGSGVPPEDRQQIFERFSRLQEGRARDEGGTGLGLALTKRIVEHHGGRIHVEDGDLGGARFVVSLPSANWTGAADPAVDEVDGTPDETTGADAVTPDAGAAPPGADSVPPDVVAAAHPDDRSG